jgi:DNA-directed RNA polymerase subunit omega
VYADTINASVSRFDPEPVLTQNKLKGNAVATEDTMMTPRIESLMKRTASKFGLVTLSARRAREINSYFNQLGEGLGTMVPPQVSSTSRKPLSISFEEIAADKILSVPLSVYEELEAELDEELLDAVADDVVSELEAVEADVLADVVEDVVVAEVAADEVAVDEVAAETAAE